MASPTTEPVLQSRLLPRISFRMMFGVTTICAVVAALARIAGNGGQLATAAFVAIMFAVLCLALFVLTFLFTWLGAASRRPTGWASVLVGTLLIAAHVSGLRLPFVGNFSLAFFAITAGLTMVFSRGRDPRGVVQSPFAADQLPPQILAPREKPQ